MPYHAFLRLFGGGARVFAPFAWFGSFRRLLIRHERLTSMYCSFLYIAATLIALRRFETTPNLLASCKTWTL
jgi:hypothetical protein